MRKRSLSLLLGLALLLVGVLGSAVTASAGSLPEYTIVLSYDFISENETVYATLYDANGVAQTASKTTFAWHIRPKDDASMGYFTGDLTISDDTERTITVYAKDKTGAGYPDDIIATKEITVRKGYDIDVDGGKATLYNNITKKNDKVTSAPKDSTVKLTADLHKLNHKVFSYWDGIDGLGGTVTDRETTITMPAEDVEAKAYYTYFVTNEKDLTANLSQNEKADLVVKTSADHHDDLARRAVLVDGKPLNRDSYEIKDNDEIVLNNRFLRALYAGDYNLTIVYEDGMAETEFTVAYDPEKHQPDGYQGFAPATETTTVETTAVTTVAEAPAATVSTLISPKTADTAPVAVLAALALVSAAAFVSMKKRG